MPNSFSWSVAGPSLCDARFSGSRKDSVGFRRTSDVLPKDIWLQTSNHPPFGDMSRQPDDTQSSDRLGSCATLQAGIRHVEDASRFDPEEEERRLLAELEAWLKL